MIRVNIREAKAHLSEYAERAEHGETVLLCRRNEPIAELRPTARRSKKRVLGNPVPGLHVSDSFFEPLQTDLEDAFSGENP